MRSLHLHVSVSLPDKIDGIAFPNDMISTMSMAAFFRILGLGGVLAVGLGMKAQTPSLLVGSAHVSPPDIPPLPRIEQLPSLDLLHMPSPYSYQRLGIFCKAEAQMDRWSPIPVMVRMGDVEKAEELDGKGAYHGAPH